MVNMLKELTYLLYCYLSVTFVLRTAHHLCYQSSEHVSLSFLWQLLFCSLQLFTFWANHL